MIFCDHDSAFCGDGAVAFDVTGVDHAFDHDAIGGLDSGVAGDIPGYDDDTVLLRVARFWVDVAAVFVGVVYFERAARLAIDDAVKGCHNGVVGPHFGAGARLWGTSFPGVAAASSAVFTASASPDSPAKSCAVVLILLSLTLSKMRLLAGTGTTPNGSPSRSRIAPVVFAQIKFLLSHCSPWPNRLSGFSTYWHSTALLLTV